MALPIKIVRVPLLLRHLISRQSPGLAAFNIRLNFLLVTCID